VSNVISIVYCYSELPPRFVMVLSPHYFSLLLDRFGDYVALVVVDTFSIYWLIDTVLIFMCKIHPQSGGYVRLGLVYHCTMCTHSWPLQYCLFSWVGTDRRWDINVLQTLCWKLGDKSRSCNKLTSCGNFKTLPLLRSHMWGPNDGRPTLPTYITYQ